MPCQSIHTTFCVRVEFLQGLFPQVVGQSSVGLTGDETVVAELAPWQQFYIRTLSVLIGTEDPK